MFLCSNAKKSIQIYIIEVKHESYEYESYFYREKISVEECVCWKLQLKVCHLILGDRCSSLLLWQNLCLMMELYWIVRIVLYVLTTVKSGNAAFIVTNPEQGKYLFRTIRILLGITQICQFKVLEPTFWIKVFSCYHPQQWLRKGNFFTGVCHSFYPWGRGVSQHAIGQGMCIPACNWAGRCTPPEYTHLDNPLPRRDGHWSGQCASYWNAFLFFFLSDCPAIADYQGVLPLIQACV